MADKNHRRVELSRIASRCRAFSNSCHLFIAGFQCHAIQIDQNQNQNRSIDKVQNPRNERRYIYKEPPQDSGQRNISYTRYPKKCSTQTYRDLYEDAMLVLTRTWMSSNMAEGNQQKHLFRSVNEVLRQKREFILRETHKHKVILFLIHEVFR